MHPKPIPKAISDAELTELDEMFNDDRRAVLVDDFLWFAIRERIRLADTLLDKLFTDTGGKISPELEAAWQQWEISKALTESR